MSNMKNIKNNFIFSILSRLITISLGLIIPKITLAEYGSEINGLLASANQLIIYLSLFEAGVQQVATKNLYKPVHDKNQQEINAILSAVNQSYKKLGFFYLIGLIFLAVIYPIFTVSDTVDYLTICLVVLFSGLGSAVLFFLQGKYRILLQVEGKNYILINTQTVITLLNNIIKIILLLLHFNVVYVVFAHFVITLLQLLYIYLYIKKKYKWINLKEKPNMKALEQKSYMLIHQIAGLIFNNTDVILITFFCGLKSASIYAVYKLIIGYINEFMQTIYTSFGFYLGQLFNTNKKEYTKIIDTVEVYYSTGIFAIYTVTLCLIVPFISLYTSGITDINYIRNTFAVMLIAVELLSFMRIPMLNTINFAGKFKETVWQSILESVINIVVSIIGVLFWDIQGVLLGTIIALLYRTTDIIIFANKKLLDRTPLKTFSVYGANLILLLIEFGIFNSLNISISSWWDFVISGLCLTPCVFALNIVVVSLIYRTEFNQIKQIFLKKIIRRKI